VKDEGFLSAAGTRFVIIAALLLIAGLAVYYATSEEISLEFLDELGTETSTSSTTFDIPEVEIPTPDIPDDFSKPPEPAKPADPPALQAPPGAPPGTQEQLNEAERILDCMQRAQGDIDAISACANR